MSLFEAKIETLRQALAPLEAEERVFRASGGGAWPRAGSKQMILEQDMGAELGNGRLPSFAAILWTEELERVRDGQIALYGPDIPQIAAPGGKKSVPFGKIVLLGVDALPADEVYASYERMDAVRFRQNLSGYMLRGTSQRNREWSRVSKEACGAGFCFAHLGSELVRDYKALPFVRRAELLFFTEEAGVRALLPAMSECCQIARALNTMFEHVSMDCKSCDAAEICEEIDGLKQLHRQLSQS